MKNLLLLDVDERDLWRWRYHLVVLAGGLIVLIAASSYVLDHGIRTELVLSVLIGAPLSAIVSRFPMMLGSSHGAGIEVGYDSSILIFLLCTVNDSEALVAWSVGVLLTQLTNQKTALSKTFNIGVGIVSGGLAAVVYTVVADGQSGTPRELLAVLAAAAAYFLADFVLSAVSISIGSQTSLRTELTQTGTVIAIACFVTFDSLGYLGAVVQRATPWWTLSLLAVPLVTLLVATRAVTRGRENARRLTVLFSAAVQAQAHVSREAVVEALIRDAQDVLQLRDVRLVRSPPVDGDLSVPVQLGDDHRWLVARSRDRATATPAGDEQALLALAAVASDAVARLDLTDEMVHVARHDPLTDLPNRGILLDRLTRALAAREEARVALLFVDLDGFKPINDRYGHAAGDEALVQLASRLQWCVRPSDTVARLGGDEFAILVEDAERRSIAQLAEQVLAAVSQNLDVAGHQVAVSASVGVAYGASGDRAPVVLGNADLAMYEAKAQGKATWVEYAPGMGEAQIERLELIDDLRASVGALEIGVVFQPVVRVDTGQVVGVEVLARWRRDGQPVPPDVFISVAEETGLIVPLGETVMRQVALAAPALREAAAGRPLTVNVNISAAQLKDPGFIATVGWTSAALEGMSLVLEITERQGVELDEPILAAMHAIERMGVAFAIDDFGVGFSSISYLRNLPARIIKVDASLTEGIDSDIRARALLGSVILMARSMDFDAVLEGIEREGQLAVLREDAPFVRAQGYHFHRPMPLADLVEVLAHERSRPVGARRTGS